MGISNLFMDKKKAFATDLPPKSLSRWQTAIYSRFKLISCILSHIIRMTDVKFKRGSNPLVPQTILNSFRPNIGFNKFCCMGAAQAMIFKINP